MRIDPLLDLRGYYLGIEIGGTKLQIGLGRGDGLLVDLWRGTVDVAAGPEGIRRQITAAVPELLARSAIDRALIRGVGIGFGGPVDDATHTIIKSHQIEGWDNFPLAEWIKDMLGWPAVLGNDADVAGLAEALFGAGKGLSPIFYITVGSGIGGGLIINGEIYRGCGRGAAEIGHLLVAEEVTPTGIRYVPLEEVASGWAIQQRARTEMARYGDRPAMLLQVDGEAQRLTTVHVARSARAGDHFALDILYRSWVPLAEGICQVIALTSPRRIVIGGGVSLMGEDIFFEPVRDLVTERVFKPFAACYDIVPAALGEEVVVHGALALARRRLESLPPAKGDG
jgi:glucokinase